MAVRSKNLEPLVSVIMPAYNSRKFVAEAIRSVLSQSYHGIELIVIDDCSTDDTFSILKELSEQDDRIKVYKNSENLGASRTRNKGLDFATGEYIAFLDADDVWHSKKIESQLQQMFMNDADLSYTSYAIVDENGSLSKGNYIVPNTVNFDELLKENFIGCSTVMISRNIADRFRFPVDYYHEDYCLWLDILKAGFKVIGCPEVLVNWRLISDSRSFNKKNSAINRWRIYRGYVGLSYIKSLRVFSTYVLRGLKKYLG